MGLLPLSLLLLVAGLACNELIKSTRSLLLDQRPHPFEESALPDGRRQGKYYESLGHVAELGSSLPQTPNLSGTKFSIFTRRKSTKGIPMRDAEPITSIDYFSEARYQFNLTDMAESEFNPAARTVVMIAGYLSGELVPWMAEPRDLWLSLEDCNVILVTWSESRRLLYSQAVAYTPLVGRQVTIFLYYLARLFGSDIGEPAFAKRIHIVGHSLGAHIAGFVGKDLAGRLGRITGLDPAGPYFDEIHESRRLDRSDALLVDVIHTNRGKMNYVNAAASAPLAGVNVLLSHLPYLRDIPAALGKDYTGEGDTAWFGIDAQLGHLDYYPNGGRVQPGCSGLMHVCDHGRAHEIFAEILRHEKYTRALEQLTHTLVERRQNRLMAFEAPEYGHFLSGLSFLRRCPELMSRQEHLGERAADSLRNCSIPIDMVTPVDLLREELTTKYGLDFQRRPGKRYFFKTLTDGNLVGRHYMLKLYLSEEPRWSAEECLLEAQLMFSDNSTVAVSLAALPTTAEGNTALTLGMPYVQPQGFVSIPHVNSILTQRDRALAAKTLVDRRGTLLPERVTLTVSEARSTSVTQTMTNKITKYLKYGKSSACHLLIGAIEVHPIVESKRSFAGLYGLEDDTKGKEIKVHTSRDRTERPWDLLNSAKLETSALRTTTRSLEAVVIDELERRQPSE